MILERAPLKKSEIDMVENAYLNKYDCQPVGTYTHYERKTVRHTVHYPFIIEYASL